MDLRRKKIVLLASAGLVLLACAGIVGWRAVTSEVGGVGMWFERHNKVESRKIVSEVLPKGLAGEAGIQVGDEVLEINGTSISEMKRLKELAAGVKGGETLTYRIKRGKKVLSIPLRLKPGSTPKQKAMALSIPWTV